MNTNWNSIEGFIKSLEIGVNILVLSFDLEFFDLKPLPTAINLLSFRFIDDAKEYFS